MSGLLARAGSVFLAPAPVSPAGAARHAPAPPPDLVGVLASPRDLGVVAGGVAADLRRRHRTRAALICTTGPVRAGLPSTRAACTLSARLKARELEVAVSGALCHVALPRECEAAVRDAWRAVAAGAGFPAVVAFAAREDAHDALLAQADLLLLASPPDADPAYAQLALGSLAALGPPAALVRTPAGVIARRLAASGLGSVAAAEVPA